MRSVTELDGSVTNYGYDELSRLTSAVRTGTNPYNESYTYDADDNRTSITKDGTTINATYDAANQLISDSNGTTYGYDRNGNKTTSGGNTYTYDASNKMVVSNTGIQFSYDGDGDRVSRTIGTSRVDYWYDATGMSQETGAQNATYSRGVGGLLSQSSGSTTHDYATDRLGSVTGLVDTNGTLTDSYSYDSWGMDNGSTGNSYNPYRYTGTYLD